MIHRTYSDLNQAQVPATGSILRQTDRNQTVGGMLNWGTTVPTDAATGYPKGSIFMKTGGSAGAMVYVNDGTYSSCNFNPLASVAGTIDMESVDTLKAAGVIIPDRVRAVFHGQPATDMVDQTFWIADNYYQVTAVQMLHAVAEATAVTLKVQVTKDTGTDAPGAGTDLLTNNTNTGFDCKATANTLQSGTLTATTASLQLSAGDRLSVDFSAAATELVGVTIVVTLKRWDGL